MSGGGEWVEVGGGRRWRREEVEVGSGGRRDGVSDFENYKLPDGG